MSAKGPETEAAHRGARVLFLQVAAAHLSPEDRDGVDRATFRAALRGLKGLNRLSSSFEVVQGDPALVLVERSRGASLLVIGRDAPVDGHDVAGRCTQQASCDVLAVHGS
ncbi:hypothetical protein ACPPVT_05010 [Angustibacter sp. McL0619]|uniref:hypothetical protein n=1 Tax=Angustibacter sp. McL0619 TaxID=3415676 RepID=UPI003CE795D2